MRTAAEVFFFVIFVRAPLLDRILQSLTETIYCGLHAVDLDSRVSGISAMSNCSEDGAMKPMPTKATSDDLLPDSASEAEYVAGLKIQN